MGNGINVNTPTNVYSGVSNAVNGDASINGKFDGGGIFGDIVTEFFAAMQIIKSLSYDVITEMKERGKFANDAKEQANSVDEIIAEAAKGDDKTKLSLPDAVINFMRDNAIQVSGMSIDAYLKKNGPDLDKGQLQAVKAGLETASSRATDTTQQIQLKIQDFTQKYTADVNAITSIISNLYNTLKGIFRNFSS